MSPDEDDNEPLLFELYDYPISGPDGVLAEVIIQRPAPEPDQTEDQSSLS